MQPPTIYPSNFPFQPRFVEVDGYRIAYLDAGQGEQTLFMVHGNPVAGYIYFKLMQHLLSDFRCIAIDLLGFGMSEKPIDEADYSLSKHIGIVTKFVKTLDLQGIVMIVHDWGGPIGLGTAVTQQQRCTHLIILNTMTEAPMRISPIYWLPFHILLRMKRLFAYLVKERNLFQKLGISIMANEDQAVYFRANHSPETRAGIAAFPRLIPYKRSHPNYPILRNILQKLEAWDIPTLVMFSDHDSVFTSEQGERFAMRLRNGRFKRIHGPKHFLQYERPAELAAEIRLFLRQK